jgi:hypothetical protein
LTVVVRCLEDENPGLEGDGVQNLAGLSSLLAALEREIRSHCLTSYYDQAPRGRRPRQAILIDAQRRLSQGGFSDAQIAALLDDGFPSRSEQDADDDSRTKDLDQVRRRRHAGAEREGGA